MAGLPTHRWDVTPAQARDIQQQLREHVVLAGSRIPPRLVAGTDVGFRDGGRTTRAAVAVLAFPSLEPVDEAVVEVPTRFPYVPGLLSFREVPALLEALAALQVAPECLLCDGQGIAHPRRFGLASHLGVLTGLPAIGVAKSRLCGEFVEPGPRRGQRSPLLDGGERIGTVLRTRDRVSPLFVSPGHRMSFAQSEALVLACAPRYRLPETTRRAHRLASG